MGRISIGLWILALLIATPVDNRAFACGGKSGSPCLVKGGGYRIVLPSTPRPHPAVVWLYGSTGKSRQLLASDRQVREFTDRGYALIVPIARDVKFNTGTDSGWSLRNAPALRPRDDIAFVRSVLADARRRFWVSSSKVLIIGQSHGAFLTTEIACHAPDTAAAYVAHAGGYLGKMPSRCQGPVRMLVGHGSNDTVVPFRPKRPRFNFGHPMTPPELSLARLAETSGCTSVGEAERFRGYDRIAWNGCGRTAQAELLVHKNGHFWPRSFPSTVMDWFEAGARAAPTAIAPANPKFKSAGSGLQGAKKSDRFKRPKSKATD